ncbi:baseplate J/gp47 family protein [Micromonospora sp. CB01531]|uniref:baseplate J/gp47 family protein n=1 Tax=Micromonospora sp. CB01531 TaxID=1718947 RepID=UPI0009391919|nr:baseplate J/gp47 family protein [Micromonospora sp. CB01531]OKI51397.1 hypothetical protein A6A27_33525 [Micromonospora sp. CB01531]
MTTRIRLPAGPQFRAGVLAAAAALRADTSGEPHVWQLPPGESQLDGGVEFGVPGRDLAIEGTGSTLVVNGGDGPAVRLVGGRVRVTGLGVRASGGALVGLDVATDASVLEGVRLADLRGADVTAVRVRGGRTRLTGLRVDRVSSRTGPASGLDVLVTGRADVLDARLRGIAGPAVRGLRVDAAAGEVRDVVLADLQPADETGLVTLSVAAALAVSGVSEVREIGAGDPVAALTAAQAAVQASPAGSEHTWLLPAGTVSLPAGLKLGAAGRVLRLRGRRTGGTATELRAGVGGAIAGDLVVLDLTGSEVFVDEVQVRAEATGALTAVRVRAQRAEVSDLTLRRLRGAEVTGLEVQAPGGAVGVVDLVADDIVATKSVAAARLGAETLVLTRPRISRITGAQRAAGIDAVATTTLSAASADVSRVTGGATAVGAALRVSVPAGELSVLGLGADQVTATGDAVGAALLGGGDTAARGITVIRVSGGRAVGLLAATTGALDLDGGAIRDIRSATGGSAGARLLIGGESAPARPVRVHGVRIEAVAGAQPGAAARPPRSWLDAIDHGLPSAVAGFGDLPLPATGAPGHSEEISGLAVIVVPVASAGPDAAVDVVGCGLHRISGTALQIDAEGRPVAVRGVEAWTSVRGGWIDGEDVLLAQLTWHRHRTGIELGPAAVQLADVIVTDVEAGLPVVGGDSGDRAIAAFTGRSQPPPPGESSSFRWAPLELAVPADLGPAAELVALYLRPGPRTPLPASVVAGGLAPATDIDLRLTRGSPLHGRALRVPGDGAGPVFLGAWPDVAAGCTLRDPLAAPPAASPAPPDVGPLVDYLARDARSLLAVMLQRARVAMPQWTVTNAADQTRMLLELLANRLDRLSYRQEVAVAEGYVGSATLRRSVTDHARLVDYRPDLGLSATAMIKFEVDDGGEPGWTLPAGTVVVNRDPSVEAVVFTTESALPYRPELSGAALASPVPPGATSAELAGHLDVPAGRWLILAGVDPEHPDLVDHTRPSHVVRVTRADRAGEVTRVFWDFRRAARAGFDVETSRVLGNVVPAHHGMPLTPTSDVDCGWGLLGELLRPWREQLTLEVDNTAGEVREVPLPHDPTSVQAGGWPFPGEEGSRAGAYRLELRVDGEPWLLADSLAAAGPFDEHFAIRPAVDGGDAVRVGDGTNGAALPRRRVRLDLATRIGLGVRGNVGAGVLTQVLSFGESGDLPGVLPAVVTDREQELLRRVTVTNPLPAVGGRDPEDVERVRARAPLAARQGLTAVVPADYERLLTARSEVAGVRARYRRAGLRDVVRVTVLLAGEDALTAAGDAGTAERLRRWMRLRAELERARLLGTDVELVPPVFVPLDVDLLVDAEPGVAAEPLRAAVVDALSGAGGLLTPDASGLGGDVRADALYRRVAGVPGVRAARLRRLRRLPATSGDHSTGGVLPVGDDEVAVLRDPLGRSVRDGLLTVTVCGGVA